MAGHLDISPKGTLSEKVSMLVLAGLLPATWTVVLVEPSGGRGASGGSTGDMAIFREGSEANAYQGDPEGEGLWIEGTPFGIDVYTPEKSTSPDGVAKVVRSKLSSQTPRGVCVDLVNVPRDKRGACINAAKVHLTAKVQALVFHVNGQDVQVFGKLY